MYMYTVLINQYLTVLYVVETTHRETHHRWAQDDCHKVEASKEFASVPANIHVYIQLKLLVEL